LLKLARAASPWVAQLILELRVQLCSAASAGEGAMLCAQSLQRFLVALGAIMLASNRSVPFEAELFQCVQNPIRRPSDLSGAIEILDAQQPKAAMRASIQEAGGRRVKGS
jgi:hypothetical protein